MAKNNNEKADDALLMRVLQDLNGVMSNNPVNSSISTASIAMSDIKRDGADQEDIHNILKNNILDQTGNIIPKIKSTLLEHENILEDLSEYTDVDMFNVINQLENPQAFNFLNEVITDYLQDVKKYDQGGIIENHMKIKINNKTYDVLIADSDEDKAKGLQDVEEMDDDEGMIFDYSNDPQKELAFWMKDTTIALDIIYIGTDNKVISVFKGIPESEKLLTESNGPIAYVLELNQNSGVKEGDKIIFEDDEYDDFDESKYPGLKPNKLYVIGSDGKPQGELQGGERIFSRKSSLVLIRKAKKAYISKEDSDYKSLGKYIFKEIKAQNERPEEYV